MGKVLDKYFFHLFAFWIALSVNAVYAVALLLLVVVFLCFFFFCDPVVMSRKSSSLRI